MSFGAPTVSKRIFTAVRSVDVNSLAEVDDDALLRPILPTLVRWSLIASLDSSASCGQDRTKVLGILSRIELVNNLVALLSIDFHALETDVRKERALRSKAGACANGGGDDGGMTSALIANLSVGPALEFERMDATRRLRLVLSEIMNVMGKIQADAEDPQQQQAAEFVTKSSELFDHVVYLAEVCDVLCIAMAELPNLLTPPEVCEALLRYKYGPNIICHVVANQPDSFCDVVFHLLNNGAQQDLETNSLVKAESQCQVRMKAILMLCQMNPNEIATVRARCVELCKMPSLALALTLAMDKMERGQNPSSSSDQVAFFSGLLLGPDQTVRSWISFYVRTGQKRKCQTVLDQFRQGLLSNVRELIASFSEFADEMEVQPLSPGGKSADNSVKNAKINQTVVKATAILRLYTALRGIAGLKFSDEEIEAILNLVTAHPPATPSGVKFVSLGLCMLIACNSLISTPVLEKRAVEWIKWLVREEDYFERQSGVSASFGEMLLLIAIHFHSQQLASICDLVCTTLGMKIAIRTSSMSRMKAIFTQEIFNEQVVASHAVKVPVTRNLSASISGYLPIHCVHQLLKSRAFSKHSVPIKDWIYRQICVASSPLHPLLPSLIEVYVTSILVPAMTRGAADQTNDAISEAEVRAVFKRPIFESQDLAVGSSKTPKATPRRSVSRSRDSTPFGGKKSRSASRRSSPKSRAQSPANAMDKSDVDDQEFGLATQILLLYYTLLYEQTRMNNMKAILTSNRKPLQYSQDLFGQIPIKFLVQTAQKQQEKFGVIYPQLLKLTTSQFPQLCLTQDWLGSEEELVRLSVVRGAKSGLKCPNSAQVKEAFACLGRCPSKLILVLEKMLEIARDERYGPAELWRFSEIVVSRIKDMLNPDVPRQVKDSFKELWFELNKVFPRKLWTLTANAINHNFEESGPARSTKKVSQSDLIVDPLQVLRCDQRIFRCGPILEIVLYVLKAFLAASRSHLSAHMLDNPIMERLPHSQVNDDREREELKTALIATQESASIQILLEAIEEKALESRPLSDRTEVQSIVCSYLHEVFISDPNMAKLVHFQGYPHSLLAVTVRGVPSLHICQDFIPELLSQPDIYKQAFAVDLISHLSIQYAMPKAYNVARLAINAMSTLLSVLSLEERNVLFPLVLPAFPRFCKAFPPLTEDVVSLLVQYGKIVVSEQCFHSYPSPKNFDLSEESREELTLPTSSESGGSGGGGEKKEVMRELAGKLQRLEVRTPRTELVQKTFEEILGTAVLEKNLF